MGGIELKPCPFCGGRAVLHVGEGVCVICTECENRTIMLVDGRYNGKYSDGAIERVAEKWNRRVKH